MICALALCIAGAVAVDGDTFKTPGQSYRVWGIDAPERDEPGFGYAKDAMRALIRGQVLSCDAVDVDRYGRIVARCDLPDGSDLACRLVAMGAAVDWPRYSGGRYAGCGR